MTSDVYTIKTKVDTIIKKTKGYRQQLNKSGNIVQQVSPPLHRRQQKATQGNRLRKQKQEENNNTFVGYCNKNRRSLFIDQNTQHLEAPEELKHI